MYRGTDLLNKFSKWVHSWLDVLIWVKPGYLAKTLVPRPMKILKSGNIMCITRRS